MTTLMLLLVDIYHILIFSLISSLSKYMEPQARMIEETRCDKDVRLKQN